MWVFVDDCYIKTLRLATILNTVYVTGNTVMIYNYDLLCYHENYRLFMIATNKKCYINSWLKVKVYSFNLPTTVAIQNILAILIWLIWVYGNPLIHFILHWVLKVTSKGADTDMDSRFGLVQPKTSPDSLASGSTPPYRRVNLNCLWI